MPQLMPLFLASLKASSCSLARIPFYTKYKFHYINRRILQQSCPKQKNKSEIIYMIHQPQKCLLFVQPLTSKLTPDCSKFLENVRFVKIFHTSKMLSFSTLIMKPQFCTRIIAKFKEQARSPFRKVLHKFHSSKFDIPKWQFPSPYFECKLIAKNRSTCYGTKKENDFLVY